MTAYNKFETGKSAKKAMNPIWRGIGCILIVLVPLISLGLTAILTPLLTTTGYVPRELMGHVIFPDWVSKVPILSAIAAFIASINNLWLSLIIFIVILVILTGISSLIYVSVLQVIGPPRYSETDAPPSKYKAKEYKR
jgi:ABC-type Na+ efflux pump permease subunit